MVGSSDGSAQLRTKDGVATLVLDRVRRRNAITLAMWKTISSLVARFEAAEDARVFNIRGRAGHFGSGNDFDELAATCANEPAAWALGGAIAAAMDAIEQARKPTVAVIEGACYGASLALTLACDLRVASPDATFAITPAKLGAVYLRSDLERLERRIGRAAALDMIFTARTVQAEEALRMGLIERVFQKGSFELEVEALLNQISRGSPFTLRSTKAMYRELDKAHVRAQDPDGIAWFVRASLGSDLPEGIQAFRASRPPGFSLRCDEPRGPGRDLPEGAS